MDTTSVKADACMIKRSRWSTCCIPTLHTPGARGPRGGVRSGRPDGNPGSKESGRAVHVGGYFCRFDRGGHAPHGRRGPHEVEFRQANILELPFEAESFDHVFVCFVLEHLAPRSKR